MTSHRQLLPVPDVPQLPHTPDHLVGIVEIFGQFNGGKIHDEIIFALAQRQLNDRLGPYAEMTTVLRDRLVTGLRAL